MIIVILISILLTIFLGLFIVMKLNNTCTSLQKINKAIKDSKITGSLTEIKLTLKKCNRQLKKLQINNTVEAKNFPLYKVMNAVLVGVSVFEYVAKHRKNIKQYCKKVK